MYDLKFVNQHQHLLIPTLFGSFFSFLVVMSLIKTLNAEDALQDFCL